MLATVMSEMPHKQEEISVQASQPSSDLSSAPQSTLHGYFIPPIQCFCWWELSGCDTHLKMQTSSHIRCQNMGNGLRTYCSAVPLICIIFACLLFFWSPRIICDVSGLQSESTTACWLLIRLYCTDERKPAEKLWIFIFGWEPAWQGHYILCCCCP